MTFGVAGLARHAGLAALFVLSALLGTLSGVLFAYSGDLPQISALDQYAPNTITRVLGKDDQLVGDFAVERRVVVRYDEIPLVCCARRCSPPRTRASFITSASIRSVC